MDLAGREATEGREGPQSPARLGVTFSVRRNRILSALILLGTARASPDPPSETKYFDRLINIFLGFSNVESVYYPLCLISLTRSNNLPQGFIQKTLEVFLIMRSTTSTRTVQ